MATWELSVTQRWQDLVVNLSQVELLESRAQLRYRLVLLHREALGADRRQTIINTAHIS